MHKCLYSIILEKNVTDPMTSSGFMRVKLSLTNIVV